MDTNELTELAEAAGNLRKHSDELIADWDKPLTFKKHKGWHPYHTVETGILWINGPFVNTFWPDRKPVKPKHACPECGAKHTIRKVGQPG